MKSQKILHQWVWCTLYNPTSRLATGHRSAQRPYGAPEEGGAMENGWKRGGRRSGGVRDQSPHLQWRADFMLSDKRSGQSEETLWICEPVNVCFRVVCVCVTLSVWELLEVLGWATERCQMFLCEAEEGLAAGQCGAVIPVFPFLPPSPSILPSLLPGEVPFLSAAVFAFTTVRES